MTLIDLSQPLYDGCPNCPVHPRIAVNLIARHPADGWHLETVALSLHSGSHLDAPLHKIPGGASIDEIPLERFTGPAYCADLRFLRAGEPVTPRMLEDALPDVPSDAIILLATGWGEKRAATSVWYHDAPYLDPAAASWLVERKARAVGIDHYSIGGSRDPENSLTHAVLLSAGMWILEDIRFPEEIFAVPQPWKFWALPIHFSGASGSFCRPVVVV